MTMMIRKIISIGTIFLIVCQPLYAVIDVAGTYTVGTGQDYATWSAAIADLPADLGAMSTPGTIILMGNTNEEIAETTDMTIVSDTDIYSIVLTVAEGVRRSTTTSVYGTGHRVSISNSGSFSFDETTAGTLNSVIVEWMSIQCTASNDVGIYFVDGFDSGYGIVQNCLVEGNVNASRGISFSYNTDNIVCRNNVTYGFSFADGNLGKGWGIWCDDSSAYANWFIYNNSSFNNTHGVGIENDATPNLDGNLYVRNNMCVGNPGGDYVLIESDADTFTINVSSDASGSVNEDDWPGYDTAFTDILNNNATLAADDAVLDNADDLSAIGAPGQFSIDITSSTRSGWYAGAYEYIAGASPPVSGGGGGSGDIWILE